MVGATETEEEPPLWQMDPYHGQPRQEEALQRYLLGTLWSSTSHPPIEGTS